MGLRIITLNLYLTQRARTEFDGDSLPLKDMLTMEYHLTCHRPRARNTQVHREDISVN